MNRLIFLPFILLGSLVGTSSEPVSLSLQSINNTAKNGIKDWDDGDTETEDFTLTGYTSVLSDLADINYIHDGSDSFSFISLEEQKQANTNSHKVFVYFSYLENSINGQNYNAWFVSISTFYQLEKSDDEIFVDYPIRLVSKSNTLCKFEIYGGINKNTAARRRYRLLDFKISYNGAYQYLHLIPGSGYEQAIDQQFFFEDDVTNIEDATELTTDEIFSNDNTLDGYSSVKSDLNQVLDIEEYSSDGIFEFLTLQEQYYKDNTYDVFIYLKFNPEQLGFDNWYISISTVLQPNEETPEAFILYPLTLVSRYGFYLKFKVGQDDINQNTATTRRYYVNDIKIKTNTNTYNSIFAYYNLDEHHWEFYFHGLYSDSQDVTSVMNDYEIITITDKAIADYVYGDSANFLWWETGFMKSHDIYNDTWYVFFNTDLDHDISSLSSVTITYKQYDFNWYPYCALVGPGVNFTNPPIKTLISEKNLLSEDLGDQGSFDYESQILTQDGISPLYVTSETKTKRVEKGLSTVYTTEYGWFNQMQVLSEQVSNIIDLENDEWTSSDDRVFAFEDYKGTYRWGVHFADTSRYLRDEHASKTTNMHGYTYNYYYSFIEGSTMADIAILELEYVDSRSQNVVRALANDNPTSDIDVNGSETPWEEDLPENFFDFIAHVIYNICNFFISFWWTLLIGIILIILIIVLLKRLFNRLSKPKEKNKVEIILNNQDSYRYFPNVRKRKKD